MTAKTTVPHGGYSRESKYDIVQHKYACTDCESDRQGYVELLEIRNAPVPWRRWTIHSFWNDSGSCYWQFASLRAAQDAFGPICRMTKPLENRMRFQESLRTVRCGPKTPWFYATDGDCLDAWGDTVKT